MPTIPSPGRKLSADEASETINRQFGEAFRRLADENDPSPDGRDIMDESSDINGIVARGDG
jgi:hypothetical protein